MTSNERIILIGSTEADEELNEEENFSDGDDLASDLDRLDQNDSTPINIDEEIEALETQGEEEEKELEKQAEETEKEEDEDIQEIEEKIKEEIEQIENLEGIPKKEGWFTRLRKSILGK